jgi:hypothetical protein
MADAYCVKCKTKRAVKGGVEKTSANNRAMLHGTCGTCGTKVTAMIAAKKADPDKKKVAK